MDGKDVIYFASDFHLGVPDLKSSLARERSLISWLDQIQNDAAEIYLVGDIFDFWFEYRHVVPKGHVRLLGKLAALVDQGVAVYLFTGNHDMWMFDYLEEEIGVKIFRDNLKIEKQGKKLFVGHGDGLGPGDRKYKFLKLFFASPLCQWLFARLHPNFSFGIAQLWSRKSRAKNMRKEEPFTDKKQEWLYQYCEDVLSKEHFDYFIFGHRHLPIDVEIDGKSSQYVNLGEWVSGDPHYAKLQNGSLQLLKA